MQSKFLALGILLAISSSTVLAQSNCRTLDDHPFGSCLETGCAVFCPLPSKKIESARLMPGFFIEYKAGRMVVTGVLPNSPASIAGVQVGDELLEVDNLPVPFDSIAADWQEGWWHTIRLRRGSIVLTKRMKMKSVQSILSQLPVLSSPIKPASFSSERNSFSVEPFLSGMLVHGDGDEFVVDTVLRNSPAERAGIRPGERFMGTKGEEESFLQYSNERRTLTLTLQGHGKNKVVSIRFASLPELLESAAAD
jgi:predicted metalloprotease with PDZ domain